MYPQGSLARFLFPLEHPSLILPQIMHTASLALLILSLPGLSPSGLARQDKTPPPDAAAERAAKAEIHTLFESDYKARDDEGYRALARKLLEQGKLTQSDPVARYVLLSEAREFAVRVLDLDTAVDAIRELSSSHAVDAAKLRRDLVAAARIRIGSAEEANRLAEFCLHLAEELAKSESFVEAGDSVPGPPGLRALASAGIPTEGDEAFASAVSSERDRRRCLLGLVHDAGRRWNGEHPRADRSGR